MKPTRSHCFGLVGKLTGQKFAGQLTPPAWKVLTDTLHECAQSNEHAEKIIDECLSAVEIVTVAELRLIAYRTRPTDTTTDGPCPYCKGTRFISSDVVEVHPVFGTRTVAKAALCVCHPIRKVRAENAERRKTTD